MISIIHVHSKIKSSRSRIHENIKIYFSRGVLRKLYIMYIIYYSTLQPAKYSRCKKDRKYSNDIFRHAET